MNMIFSDTKNILKKVTKVGTTAIVAVFLLSSLVVASTSVSAQGVCDGGTQIIVDETGSLIQCRDSLGNVCLPGDLVEGSAPGTKRCPTTGSGEINTGFVPPASVSTNASCGDVDVAIDVNCEGDEPVMAYVRAIINFLAGGVGLVVITMVAIGGVQYMMAGGNPQATQAAVKRIIDAFIGLLFFIFLYAFLQWIIPGGYL